MPGGSPGFASIVFDFDSTLSAIEGIDELAGERRDEVRAMTDRAMSGEIPLEEVYGRRLALIRPRSRDMEALGARYVEELVQDAAPTLAALRWLGKEIRVVSGGLVPPILTAARALGLREDEVAAVSISFDPGGEYLDFDRGSALARSGGKEEIIRGWRLPRPALLVGDGATDLEARPAVDAFAAFTGVVHRAEVTAGADFVISGPSLAPVLALAASHEERERLRSSGWADLAHRAGATPPHTSISR